MLLKTKKSSDPVKELLGSAFPSVVHTEICNVSGN